MIRRTFPAAAVVLLLGSLAGWAAPGDAEAGAAASVETHELRGFSLGLQFQTSLIDAEDPPEGGDPDGLYIDEVGHGLSVGIGYGVTPSLGLRLSIDAARHPTTQQEVEAFHSTIVLEVLQRLLPRRRVQPYLLGGLGGAGILVDREGYRSEISGIVGVVGLGVVVVLGEHFLLDASGRLDLINWRKVKLTRELPEGGETELVEPVEESGRAGRIRFGLVWFLGSLR